MQKFLAFFFFFFFFFFSLSYLKTGFEYSVNLCCIKGREIQINNKQMQLNVVGGVYYNSYS